jgi:hypothetical protein
MALDLSGIFGGDASGPNRALAKKSAADQKKQDKKAEKKLEKAYSKGREELKAGKAEGLGYQDESLGLYAPLQAAASGSIGRYGDFFGAGGQAGFDSAQANWEASPTYQAMTDYNRLGIQGIDRQANARGNPYNFTDQADFLQGSASKYLGDYTSGAYNMANLERGLAGDQAGIYNNKSNIATGTGTSLNSNLMGQGNQLMGNRQAMGQHAYQSGVDLAGINSGSAANNAQLWGNILGAAGSVAGAYAGKPVTNYNF